MIDNSKKKVVYKALAFTFAVLFFGILFANIIYDWQKSDLDQGLIELNNISQDTDLFLKFYDISPDVNSCDILQSEFEGFAGRVYEIGKLTEQYTTNNKNVEELKEIQTKHVYYKLELWMELLNYNKICDKKKDYILYFYKYNCSECAPLATEIMDLVHNNEDIWVFSIPSEIDIKTIKVIEDYFNIEYYPAVVVNGTVLHGADSYSEIKNYLNNLDKIDG